ncbi:MAG: alpha/beta fold hydrolase [Saccharofermentans sp.]|nr:alpha/beta fold hydrolase [Saccharofermentans sp.]
MRKISLSALLLVICLLTSCGQGQHARTIGPVSYKVDSPEVTYISDREADIVIRRDDRKIEGKLYLPEGEGPYPLMIMSTGLYALYGEYEHKAKMYAERGFAALVFNFVSNADANSDALIKDQDLIGLLRSQVTDLSAVLDSIGEIKQFDRSRVFLWGHSYGGLVSCYVCCRRQDEIKGLILVEPSLDRQPEQLIPGDKDTAVNIGKDLAQCEVNTLIFVGSQSSYGKDPDCYAEIMAVLQHGQLIRVEGADHLFGGRYGDLIVERSCEMITS